MTELEQALLQLQQIESFCNLCDNLPEPPSNIPQDKERAAGLEPEVWHGLGLVGLWAAIDAFTERRPEFGSDPSLPKRLDGKLLENLMQILKELEDMRHLYAHNFAGSADALYFKKPRNFFQSNTTYHLASGACFDGGRLILTLRDLRFYIKHTQDILKHLDKSSVSRKTSSR